MLPCLTMKAENEEMGMVCPKCARVCRAEIVDNGPNVIGLAHCCGWAFDGWPDTPIPPDPREQWVRDAHEQVTDLFHRVSDALANACHEPRQDGPRNR